MRFFKLKPVYFIKLITSCLDKQRILQACMASRQAISPSLLKRHLSTSPRDCKPGARGTLLRVRKRLSRGRLQKGKFESLCCLLHELGA